MGAPFSSVRHFTYMAHHARVPCAILIPVFAVRAFHSPPFDGVALPGTSGFRTAVCAGARRATAWNVFSTGCHATSEIPSFCLTDSGELDYSRAIGLPQASTKAYDNTTCPVIHVSGYLRFPIDLYRQIGRESAGFVADSLWWFCGTALSEGLFHACRHDGTYPSPPARRKCESRKA